MEEMRKRRIRYGQTEELFLMRDDIFWRGEK